MIPLRRHRAIQCQVNGRLSVQACGAKADQIYRCEIIGPHDRHQVGRHTLHHALAGNGYTCSAIEGEGLIDELAQLLDEKS